MAATQPARHRSACPINLTVEVLGDSWSLIIIRDVIFGDRRHYRRLLEESEEGIASNILGDRLKRLLAAGVLTRAQDPTHRQRRIYSLTEAGIQLVPVLVQLGAWGRRHQPASAELSVRARLLEEGGPALWEEFMEELRGRHLRGGGATEAVGQPLADPAGGPRSALSVLERLDAAYQEAVARGVEG
ncbi:winged helix-turn-helix transcriptional regulator [Nesterenkonia xinjiangensis]|uniref:DNA-binding HxlR family transcriptional regulator n=1 Tax=Nesterenkonia xinjiangensis TaxID=225327 RepID=A0A7Z0K9T9_9MICC|nr:helix-turn-helix domain-containing protein [Nesterenkonia xinjiangensis]NYJ79056.1 DNA-binding HxlR family transcriptional regulator [Nesterenkonia xinjiangensis]